MIHEVRNQILRSIDLLPYSVYRSSILAADSEKERNIRTNYKAHVDIFNIIKNLVQQKKVGKGPRNILEYSLNLSVDRIINQNSFEETIKNSIFACDIEPSAVDIAKLRLWLSLVIDNENLEPHPLPNLECNIICADISK